MASSNQGLVPADIGLRKRQIEPEAQVQAGVSDDAPHRQARQETYHNERKYGAWWSGCTMTRLLGGCTETRADVVKLAQFINAIHTWGEGRHAAGVVDDVVALYPSAQLEG